MVFQDFQVPFYEEAKELVTEAAKQIPQIKIIGWDIAIQPDGPILIEGNDHPGIRYNEIVMKGFGKNPVFLEMFNEALGKD
ncbi:MAG: hypothetical protein HC906_18385 [Bacteroidales bacterium]|nr:hypothetical protein [Bacteroidales bacterium]